MPGARGFQTRAYKTLCELMREMRVNANMTQRDLGAKLHVTHTYVHKVEVGDRRIDPLEFVAWCEATGHDAASTINAVIKICRDKS